LPLPQQQDRPQEKCAVFGAYGVGEEASRVILYGLWALQHRGQESSGIATIDNQGQLHRHVGPGLVATVYREEDMQQLPGSIAIGHNRYSTSGGANDAHSQPIVTKTRTFAFAHNGNLPVTDELEAFLDDRGIRTDNLNDSEMMAEAIGVYLEDGLSLEDAVAEAYPLFTGAFCLLVMAEGKLIALRDNCGIRPMSIGSLGDGYVVASETCAFDTVGAQFLRDVRPGEMVVIDDNGLQSRQLAQGDLKVDIFELVYFARPDSVIEGMSVNTVRQKLGMRLAIEFKIDADIVVPVPDSAVPAAIGYARASGVPFEMGLIKNRYIHRTFIRPSQELRDKDLQMKLNPLPAVLEGKKVILIDDSIVRGTSTRAIVKKVFEAGAKEVHVLISSPPIRYPDFYGINISTQGELIAAHASIEQIREELGATSLGYLSYDGMIRATGRPADDFCTACFNGVYPIDIGHRRESFVDFPSLEQAPLFGLS
jgi:amidophosphoribosyltransferase